MRIAEDVRRSELLRLGVIDGPRWEDCCHHKPTDYVATFEYSDRTGPPEDRRWFTEVIDLYVVQCHGEPWQSLCLRFGNEPGDYYSGPIQIVWDIQHLPYTAAKAILLLNGKLVWQPTLAKEG